MGVLDMVREALWGWPTLLLILGAGAYYSYETCFFQVRRVALWLRSPWGGAGPQSGESVSKFQALTAALAGSIGTGNIVGVGLALSAGGPGALFWMWVSAILGMMTVFVENFLAARCKGSGSAWAAGSIRTIESAGRWGKRLALVYACGCCLSSLGMGNMVQMHALSAACGDFGLPAWGVGLAAAALLFFVARGGLRFAVRITEKLVPAMTLLFFGASLFVLWTFRDALPGAVGNIFQEAFSLRAGAGGTAGMLLAMKSGVSRGVFTNEAGLGSSAFAYEEVRGRTPLEVGCLGIFQVFLDTLVMCTVTGLCILCCPGPGLAGTQLTFHPYRQAMGQMGQWAVSVCTILFALATAIAWCCYGRSGLFYLTRGRGRTAFALVSAGAAFLGCLLPLEAVFSLADACNGLMALPNTAALFLLAKQALAGIGQAEHRVSLGKCQGNGKGP